MTINLNYTDGIDDISTLTAPATGTTTLTIPTARDIRVRLYPRCDPTKANYYGTDRAQIGLSTDYIVRHEASSEDALFPNTPESQLQAFYFQPGTNLPQLLAQQLALNQQALTFTGASGLRTVFGASGTLRHNISGDGSSLTIANQTELLGHWIVALVLDIERDWTWDGLAKPPQPPVPPQVPPPAGGQSSLPQIAVARGSQSVGVVTVPRVVSPAARREIPIRLPTGRPLRNSANAFGEILE